MKSAELEIEEPVVEQTDCTIQMPLGLLGFERIKRYVLMASQAEEPFMWLEMVDDPGHGFLMLSPYLVMPDYEPEISREDERFLQASSPDDVLVLNIVSVRGPDQATINLKGPVIINRRTLIAKQVILANAAEYNLQHPLPVNS